MGLNLSKTLKRFSALSASLLLLAQMALPLSVSANGNGSPAECWDNKKNNPSNHQNVIGDVIGTADLVSKDVGVGKIVAGVCIKSGDNMFGEGKHSTLLGNGTYSGLNQDGSPATPECYTVSGVGTKVVTVERTGTESNTCQGISHIDIVVMQDSTPNYCDPSQKPGGTSIDNWVPKDVHCVTPWTELSCGTFDAGINSSITGPWGDDYGIAWSEGAPDYNQFTPTPVTFTEDYNGGSVTIYYWIVGPEAGYVKGHGFPNYWDQNAASVVINTDCQNPPTGSIKVSKKVNNGNGYVDDNPSQYGFVWGLDNETPARAMGSTQSNVPVGNHTVTENSVSGYEFTGWYNSSSTVYSCENPKGKTLPIATNVEANETRQITLCNKKIEDPKGSITIIKDVEDGEDEQDFEFSPSWGQESNFILDDDSNSAQPTNSKTFSGLDAGEYTITELETAGWDFEEVICEGIDEDYWDDDNSDQSVTIDLPQGAHAICTFVNEKDEDGGGNGDPDPGSIKGQKFHDENKNGVWDEGEEVLSGWTIELSVCLDNISVRSAARFLNIDTADGTPVSNTCENLHLIESDITDENGKFEFTNLESGQYWVCEVQRDGWIQSYPVDENGKGACWLVEVTQGNECIVNFGNKAKEPGNVLGETPKPEVPEVLVETGSPILQALLVGMSIITAAGTTLAYTKKQKVNI